MTFSQQPNSSKHPKKKKKNLLSEKWEIYENREPQNCELI